MVRLLLGASAALLAAACQTSVRPDRDAEVEAPETVSLHESMIVFDSHLDTPANFSDPAFDLLADNPTRLGQVQVDLPKMERGGLDGGFWVIFTPQGPLDDASMRAARDAGLFRAVEIREQAAKHDEFVLVTTADAAEAVAREGRKTMLVSMENAYPLMRDVSLLETYHRLGLRMVGPVHFRNNQFADSATDITPVHGGLSPLGRDLVEEANRLGMIVDGSHAADSSVRDMIALSTTPIILSHTGVKAVFDHPRNIDDVLLKELADSGGVIQINAFGGYLELLEPTPERAAALAVWTEKYGDSVSDIPADRVEQAIADRREIDAEFPPPRSTFEKFYEHLIHALDVIGPDHVGIGADWDGGGGTMGMEDVSDLPQITERLLADGYSPEDIEKIWSGNMMRLLRAAEAAAEPVQP